MNNNSDSEEILKEISEYQKELLNPSKLTPTLPKKLLSKTFKNSNDTLKNYRRNDIDYINNEVTFVGQQLNGNIINIHDDLRHNNNCFQFINTYRMHKGNI